MKQDTPGNFSRDAENAVVVLSCLFLGIVADTVGELYPQILQLTGKGKHLGKLDTLGEDMGEVVAKLVIFVERLLVVKGNQSFGKEEVGLSWETPLPCVFGGLSGTDQLDEQCLKCEMCAQNDTNHRLAIAIKLGTENVLQFYEPLGFSHDLKLRFLGAKPR